ncbi:MAG TPA: type II toxin-antitoxin system ParD family antitoxin [Phycisphaerae bacterium]|nr:type II toxin-antitoxin system ParD family antitoxin [Phycisphaerae bacterium]
MTTMNISLPDDLKAFVEKQVTTGGYGSVSEYVRELLRAAKKAEAQARLEALLLEGLNSGEPVEVTPEFWEDVRQRAREKLKAQKQHGKNR